MSSSESAGENRPGCSHPDAVGFLNEAKVGGALLGKTPGGGRGWLKAPADEKAASARDR